MVTDGVPNCICEGVYGNYTGRWMGNDPGGIAQGKASAKAARNYLLSKLEMAADQDEFDAIAVGDGPDADWLKDYIVWPGSYIWPEGSSTPPGPGWVRLVSNYEEFAESIHELFVIFFSDISNTAEIISTTPIDLNPENNKAWISISPTLP